MSDKNINNKSFLSISEALEISTEDHKSLDENEMLLQIERRVAELMEREVVIQSLREKQLPFHGQVIMQPVVPPVSTGRMIPIGQMLLD